MGVKTHLSLEALNRLFAAYEFSSLVATDSGVIDTTYIASCVQTSYILKKYEREIAQKVEEDKALLEMLHLWGLNVPRCVESSKGWHLYEKLQGRQPRHIRSYHIQALARFLAKMHQCTYKKKSPHKMMDQKEIASNLGYAKRNFYAYYKKLQTLQGYKAKEDGTIHGDLFKDNTVFDGEKIGVFDFIDSACGNFALDAGVALLGFDVRRGKSFFISLFLGTYNQHAPKKLTKKELLASLDTASRFYTLKRIVHFKNTKKAKELMQ